MVKLLTLLLAVACLQDSGQDAKARVDAWMETLGERITELVPEPIDGIERFMPWDVEADHPPIGGCFFGCTQYVRLEKERAFVVAEPELVARADALEKQALEAAMKLAGGPMDEKAVARVKAMGDAVETLKRSVRRIEVRIALNAQATLTRGVENAGKPAGTIAGYPVYRFAFDDESYGDVPSGVRLAVALGPATFKNPTVDPSKMQTEVKTIVVSAAVQSRRETVKADEALIRKLLETVKYDELAKLLSRMNTEKH